MRKLARRLLVYEKRGNSSSDTETPAAFHVCETLRPHLATLMGNAGFRALLSRALALASPEVPWLHSVRVEPEGSLAGWDELEGRVAAAEAAEGSVVLLAQLLGLLVALIGEDLTLRMMREVWPKLPLIDLESGREIENEKDK